ncbi:MAG: DUF1540 domain-containing protein [Clostridia bacterium]|nr:DUF1540 domain-containing protein [Clostridia bacterium]
MENNYNANKTMDCIHCSVTNCVYNSSEKCSAGEIHVGPQNACSVSETGCETFESK